jgi:multidrug efflux pump subunit AcrA (membrane-fusion protein)
MWVRVVSAALAMAASGVALGQAPPASARVETAPLELKSPDRYQVPCVLEPIRKVTLTAPADGILRNMEAQVGASVREGAEIAQFDRTEAAARLKIAQAQVKEQQATLKNAPNPGQAAIAQAQLEAAQARAEIAQLELDRCTLRAPFAGRLLAVTVSPGQYLNKGATVAELADETSLRVLVPLERATASSATVNLDVEGQAVSGKVQATLPLPESLAVLRELAMPMTAAWVVVANPKGALEPGQRVAGPALPVAPIATIPARALHQPAKGETGGPSVQVIRNEYATNVPVRVLGQPGPDRVQVSGSLRPTDTLILASSVPLLAGTLVRFGVEEHKAIEATSPNPAEGGSLAGISPPSDAAAPTQNRAPATKGASPSVPTTNRAPAPATKPAATPKAAVPF